MTTSFLRDISNTWGWRPRDSLSCLWVEVKKFCYIVLVQLHEWEELYILCLTHKCCLLPDRLFWGRTGCGKSFAPVGLWTLRCRTARTSVSNLTPNPTMCILMKPRETVSMGHFSVVSFWITSVLIPEKSPLALTLTYSTAHVHMDNWTAHLSLLVSLMMCHWWFSCSSTVSFSCQGWWTHTFMLRSTLSQVHTWTCHFWTGSINTLFL